MQGVVAAVITGLLVAVGMKYFRGNALGFVGFCFLFLVLVYGIYAAARYRNRTRANQILPREPPSR